MSEKIKKTRKRSYDYCAGYILKAYLLAKSGLKGKTLARALGIDGDTLRNWKEKHEHFAAAIQQGRDELAENPVQTFREYVYGRLSESAQATWDKINEFEDEENGLTRIEALLRERGKPMRQHLFLYALVASNFNPSEACRKVNIPYMVFRKWCESDPDFADLVEEIHVHKGNFFEAALVGLVGQGDSAATIFANKTFNKDRGYGEKLEVHHTDTNHVIIEDLDLPLEDRKRLLEAIRRKKAAPLAVEDKSNVIDVEFVQKGVENAGNRPSEKVGVSSSKT